MKLPNGAWLVVADGERHLVLENRGDAELIDLRVVMHESREARSDAEAGQDRPGRFPVAGGRRETVEQTDWKRLDKTRFATELAEWLDAAAAEGAYSTLAVAADPRTLGALRMHWTARVRARLAGEIAADLTHAPVPEIEAAVKRA
jgi:protein required for attachment to host cells